MHWSGLGLNGTAWELRLRDLEHVARRLLHSSALDPEDELPGAELPDSERRAATVREVARRTVEERG